MKYSELSTKISGIYRIDFPNGKVYIGRAINIKRRIWEHYNKIDNTPCQKDLLNPELSIIEIADKYQCSRDTIGDINQGKRYVN